MATLLFWPAAAVVLAGPGTSRPRGAAAGFAACWWVASIVGSQTSAVPLRHGTGLAGGAYRRAPALLRSPCHGRSSRSLSLLDRGRSLSALRSEQWLTSRRPTSGHVEFLGTAAAEVAAAPLSWGWLEGLRLEIAGASRGRSPGSKRQPSANAAIQIRLGTGVLGLVLSSALIAALTLRLLGDQTANLTLAVPVLTGLIAFSLYPRPLGRAGVATISLVRRRPLRCWNPRIFGWRGAPPPDHSEAGYSSAADTALTSSTGHWISSPLLGPDDTKFYKGIARSSLISPSTSQTVFRLSIRSALRRRRRAGAAEYPFWRCAGALRDGPLP